MPVFYQNVYALLKSPGAIEFHREEISLRPRSDYIRIRVAHCALCGSDLAFYRGRPGASYPRTLGHEYYGFIEATGDGVRDFHPEDRVVVDPNYRCGQCKYCKSGASNLCEQSEANLFDQRGLSCYVDIHYSYLHKLPELNPYWLGALIEPLSCALHAISLASPQPEDRILILGCGGQGSLLAFALTRLLSNDSIDVYDPNQERCINLSEVFKPRLRSLVRHPKRPEYSLIFEASGKSAGFKTATLALGKGGRIIVISRYDDRRAVNWPHDFPRKQAKVIFSHLNGDGKAFSEALKLLQHYWQPPYNNIIQVLPWDDLPSILKHIDTVSYSKTIFDLTDLDGVHFVEG